MANNFCNALTGFKDNPLWVLRCVRNVRTYVRHEICPRYISQTAGLILTKFSHKLGTAMKGVAFAIWTLSSNIRA